MFTPLLHSLQSEWLKTRRSASTWLVIAGGLLVPMILLAARFYRFEKMAAENLSPRLWLDTFQRAWQYMGMLLLPMGVMLVTSLVTQMEYRNNTWKQVHALPQSFTTIFFAKFLVITALLLQGFLLFNAGVYLVGAAPALLSEVAYPTAPFPWKEYVTGTGRFFLGCLPILALQYLLSLQFRNFLVPIGIGFALYVASMIALNWKHGFIMPYIYSAYQGAGMKEAGKTGVDLLVWAGGYFVLFILAAYLIYIRKEEKV